VEFYSGFLMVFPVFLPDNLLFPLFVKIQYSLFHCICYFVSFPVFDHALPAMERTWLFAVLRPNEIFRRVDAENNPAVLAFCKYSFQFPHE